MEQYKQEFIEFMIDCNVLKFGDFVTKSGRKTPFFVNTGFYRTGAQLRKLGQYYAKAIESKFGLDFDVLFGPAYKGIPLSVAATMEISEMYGKDIRYCSNRKEVKDHGDTGILLGSKIKDGDRVMIIEDVTTSGKSIEETFPIITSAADIEIKGMIVSLNRLEKGKSGENKTALTEIQEKYGMTRVAIRSQVYRNNIPSKKEHGQIFYSKLHFDLSKSSEQESKTEYYTVKEAMEKFKLSRDSVYGILQFHQINREKNGRFVRFLKVEFDRVMGVRK